MHFSTFFSSVDFNFCAITFSMVGVWYINLVTLSGVNVVVIIVTSASLAIPITSLAIGDEVTTIINDAPRSREYFILSSSFLVITMKKI